MLVFGMIGFLLKKGYPDSHGLSIDGKPVSFFSLLIYIFLFLGQYYQIVHLLIIFACMRMGVEICSDNLFKLAFTA